jgi:uncharacterized protein YkwD
MKSWSCIFALVLLLTACNTRPAVETGAPTPLAAAPTPTVTETSAAPEATATSAPTPAASPTPAPSPTAARTATPAKIQYTVKRGDTFFGLAKEYHTSIASIQIANGMGENQSLRAGQTLDIPTGPRFEGESPYWIVHVVQKGDTLGAIAQAFGLTQNDIARVNGISDPSLVRLGQNLVIPLDTFRAAVVPPTPSNTATPTSQPTPTARPAQTGQPTSTSQATSIPLATATTGPTMPTATTGPTVPTATPGSIPADIASWPNMVLSIINDKRADAGLKRYKMSPLLTQAAQGQANDCSSRGWCSHVGSDGSDTKTRILRTGYTPMMFGENWMQANDPDSAVASWFNEKPPNDPHRQNLLNTGFTEIGVGVARAGQGYYFVVDFGSR